ncbi:hypothetical protein B0A52_01533 [Exophiala mesophila]|uniref:Uncharacterized protein n=1 Tax=Exophiala mesophila TaxID=212818 RepID=A0A438NF94_EXOME|nr:hypothetical protein B0A52_01533 [Exophiala mesophila]
MTMPNTPTSPVFLPPSPQTPMNSSITTSTLDFAPTSSPKVSVTPNSWSQNGTNGSSLRRNSSSMSLCSPRGPWNSFSSRELSSPVTPFLHIPTEDGRYTRSVLRSPHLDRVMTLPLRVNTSMFPSFPLSPMTPITQLQEPTPVSAVQAPNSLILNWSPPQSPTLPTPRGLSSSPGLQERRSRSPIRRNTRHRGHNLRRLALVPPPKYHVTVIRPPLSPNSQQRKAHYQYSVDHLRAPLVPLISVTNGLAHPDFPKSLLQYHLLTHEQLDSLACWYHQVFPPVRETFQYPAWVPAWTSLPCAPGVAGPNLDAVDLETKRRRWGRFIGLRGCESPTSSGPPDETPDELTRRMENEWKRALERAEEEDRAWEKSWRGRW